MHTLPSELASSPSSPDSIDQTFEQLRLALDAGAIVGTWIWDIFEDRVRADERFAKSFGLSIEACRAGVSLWDTLSAIHVDDQARVEKAIEQALQTRSQYRCEYRIQGHDGQYRWVEASGRVEVDAQGTPARFPGILIDITHRRAAEAERDRALALLRMFTEAVPGVVYAKDRQGRMLVANRGLSEVIGKPAESYLGRTDAEFLEDAEQARIIMETDQRIMSTATGEVIEEHVTRLDGTVGTWLSTKAPLFDDSGVVIGLIGSSVDVTARKNAETAIQEMNKTLEQRIQGAIQEREDAESALRQSQKMEAVGQLTGGIAHDFNNLLTGISGCLEAIQSRLDQGRFTDLERYVSVAQGVVQRGASLTHRLLAFSRRQVLEAKPTNVNALITEMEEFISRSVGPSIELSIQKAADLWPAHIDAGQLENALLNLCINARDAMADGGQITIAASNVCVGKGQAAQLDLPEGSYLCISVTDTGVGMTAATLSKVFEPFFTTKPVGQGTGLGLSMVYGFARQSGGQVHITSALGQGTTVTLYLPRFEGSLAHTPSPTSAPPLPKSYQDLTVLIVEDDAAIRMLLTEVVQALGCTIIEATDSMAGARILESELRLDLLIADIGLPGGKNGREMVEPCRKNRPNLKILFVTGYAEDATNEHIGRGKDIKLLAKPFSLDTLKRLLRELIAA